MEFAHYAFIHNSAIGQTSGYIIPPINNLKKLCKFNGKTIIGNNYVDLANKRPIHAEIDLISRLPYNRHKLRIINILVVRFDEKNNIFKMSKPCENCIANIKRKAIIKGYIIGDIYYSNIDGTLCRSSYVQLENDTQKYVSSYFRMLNRLQIKTYIDVDQENDQEPNKKKSKK